MVFDFDEEEVDFLDHEDLLLGVELVQVLEAFFEGEYFDVNLLVVVELDQFLHKNVFQELLLLFLEEKSAEAINYVPRERVALLIHQVEHFVDDFLLLLGGKYGEGVERQMDCNGLELGDVLLVQYIGHEETEKPLFQIIFGLLETEDLLHASKPLQRDLLILFLQQTHSQLQTLAEKMQLSEALLSEDLKAFNRVQKQTFVQVQNPSLFSQRRRCRREDRSPDLPLSLNGALNFNRRLP